MPASADHPLFDPRPTDDEAFGETWTAIADLGAEGYLQVQLGVTNVGPGSGKGVCRLLYVPGQGRPTLKGSQSVDREEWSHALKPASTLSVGACQGTAEPSALVIKAVVEGGEAVLRLKAAPQRIHPPGHHVTLEEDFYTSTVLVPWADAEVELKLGEGPARQLIGRGYADHSRATTLPADLARRWVRVRSLASGKGLLILARFPAEPEQAAPQGWIWAEGQAAPAPLDSFSVTPAGEGWSITAKAGSAKRSVLTEQLLHRAAPVEDQGWLAPMIRAVIGNPVTRTWRTPQGVLEVTVVDE